MSNNFNIKKIKNIVSVLTFILALFLFNIDVKADDSLLLINDYGYEGEYKTFIVPYTGTYKFETWGAQGGQSTDGYLGGKGAYTSGNLQLTKGEILYIYVGQGGVLDAYGFNGGGYSYQTSRHGGGGGGATDIRLVSGNWKDTTSLASRIMVAAGGGGSAYSSNGTGGAGGALTGASGNRDTRLNTSYAVAQGGTQIAGGAASGCGGGNYCYTRTPGGFGYGGNSARDATEGDYRGGGGGSGYYGGGGGADGYSFSGAGGSSYISGYTGSVAIKAEDDITPKTGCTNGTTDITCSYHYSGKIFTDTVMKSGSEVMPTYDGTSTMTGNSGNGHAKVSFFVDKNKLKSITIADNKGSLKEDFDHLNTNYTWVVPKNITEFTDEDVSALPFYEDSQVIIPESVPYTQDGDIFEIEVIGSDSSRETYTLTMERFVSSDARLSGITSDKGKFKEEFDPERTNYTLEVFENAESITLSATALEQDNQGITGIGEITLDDYERDTEIISTAEDGTIKVYNIHIIKNMYLKNIALEGLGSLECEEGQCEILPEFNPEITNYNIKVPSSYNKLNVTYVPSHEGLTVGIRVDNKNYVAGQNFYKNEATVDFNIYNQSNEIIKTYKLSILKENKDSVRLKDLQIKDGKGYLLENFDKTNENYTWIIPKGVNTLTADDVITTLFDSTSDVKKTQSVEFSQDGEVFEVTVNAKNTIDLGYSGTYYEFNPPYSGTYKIEAWGAQGGNSASYSGGKGAYTSGFIDLTTEDTLYVYVGQQGIGEGYNFNGGGKSYHTSRYGSGGGGATDIRLVSGNWKDSESLASRIMVAGAGGGAAFYNYGTGGVAGALNGLAGTYDQRVGTNIAYGIGTVAQGGTQTSGGTASGCGVTYGSPTSRYCYPRTPGGFGYGGDSARDATDTDYRGGGGGSGYYGGGGGADGYSYSGAGGSSYISGYTGSVAIKSQNDITPKAGCSNGTTDVTCSYHYSGMIFNEPVMKAGNQSMPTYDGLSTMVGNSGDGHVKITRMNGEDSSFTKTYRLVMQREVSNDTRLSEITATAETGEPQFTEEFDKDKREYVLELYKNDSKVTIDALPYEQDATIISGLGDVNLPTDETTHSIMVQAEDGTIEAYTITIRKNMYLEDLGLRGFDGLYCKPNECVMTPEFTPEIENYTYYVPVEYETLDAYYYPASGEHRSEMTINGEPYVDDYKLPLQGKTIVEVHIYNDNDEIVKTYTINVISEYKYIEDFDYTGDYQVFIAPRNGKYKMETWGAQGGNSASYSGGKGAYASGYITLTKGERLYIYVGQQGKDEGISYNGGGKSYHTTRYGSGGGGATDIRLVNGTWNNQTGLASRIMVAGAGGGAAYYSYGNGGAGGALTGLDGTYDSRVGTTVAYGIGTVAKGGTQTSGGAASGCGVTYGGQTSTYCYTRTPGGFGYGGDSARDATETDYRGGGGGSGYFGGGGGADGYSYSGAGGSSYISGYAGSIAIKNQDEVIPKGGCEDGTEDITCSYHYSGKIFEETVMKAGNEEMPSYDGLRTMVGNSGNGHAKIRLEETDTMLTSLSVDSMYLEEEFDKFSTEYTWIIPKGVDEFTSDDITATLLHPERAHIEWPSEPVQFTKDGDKFTFKVVADNGEEDTYTLTMIRYKSNDARLKTLTSDKGIFTSEFDPDTDSYTLELYSEEEMIHIDGTTIDPDATVSGLGDITIDSSEITREILVTAENGDTKVYSLLIRSDSYLVDIGLNGLTGLPCMDDECILNPSFEPVKKEYEIKVPFEYNSLDVYYLLANYDNTVEIQVNGETYTKGQSLLLGETEVKFYVSNEDNILVNTYTLNIIRQKGNHATLDNLEVSVGELDNPFDREIIEYTWIIPSNISTNLENYVSYTLTDPSATVELIPSTINYTADGDTFDVKVTAEDGETTKTYKITLQQDIIEDIEVEENMVIAVGETKNLYVNGLPEGSVGKYLYEVDQNAIAVVYENGDVYGVVPGDATITINVKNHPEITPKTVHVTVLNDKITSQVLDVLDKTDDRIIIGEEPLTNINDFLDKLDNPKEYLKVYDKDDNLIEESDYDDTVVSTGMKVKLVINDIEHDEVIVIIRGDINGDGVVDVTDEAIMTDHILGAELIEGIGLYAADIQEDEITDVSDDSLITDYILGAIDSLNE